MNGITGDPSLGGGAGPIPELRKGCRINFIGSIIYHIWNGRTSIDKEKCLS